MQDNQDKELSADEVQSIKENKRNPGVGEIFHTRPDWSWSPLSFQSNGYRVFFPGVKPPSSAEVKERVEL
jgi:hypothetical protein